jgi:hypothetical protein
MYPDSDPDLDPDFALFVIDLQDANTKLFLKNSAFYFLKVHLHHFSKIRSPKEVTKQLADRRMIEGSGSIYVTNGSGSGRPKIMWIRNTGYNP